MEKMLVVAFESEQKAYEGVNALSQLDSEGSITVHAVSVIKKNDEGKTVVLKTNPEFPIGTLGGTSIGSLIGLLGGPYGVIVGAASGSLVGLTADLYVSGVDGEFVDDVSKDLKPGAYAVVADISEEWITPLDVQMEKIGGKVFRSAKKDVETEQINRDIAAMDKEIKQLEMEASKAPGEMKAKLQAKIDNLKEKRQKKVEQANKRFEQMEKEHNAKVQALEERSAKARGETKAAIDARIAEINEGHQRTVAKRKNMEAELEKKADKLVAKAKILKN
ncbi:MAG TPA: DUF1269 domain-containing protein [Methanocella sp.]|uniref:DUF1269 domain-containing protein n=1 Tax=Methanocella sp. TaxID=2052833 RepID=UPI002C37A5C8|nr:DUF1269 domain-containing protein [Methanocella sp.]HTY91334.1 DUF1269 domain-containing protein [Methanocella sp.]